MVNTIVNRYVEAFFHLAKKKGCLEKVQADFVQFLTLGKNFPKLFSFLKNFIISKAKKEAVLRLFAKVMQKETLDFFSLVVRKKRGNLLPKIAHAFIETYKKSQHICLVTVYVARPISSKTEEKLKVLVAQLAPCEQIAMDIKIVPKIIGGYVLYIGPYRLDGSIQTRLKQLQQLWLS